MVVYAILRRKPGASLQAGELVSRPAKASRWLFEERRSTIVRFWVELRRVTWAADEARPAARLRSLMEDNPTSG